MFAEGGVYSTSSRNVRLYQTVREREAHAFRGAQSATQRTAHSQPKENYLSERLTWNNNKPVVQKTKHLVIPRSTSINE